MSVWKPIETAPKDRIVVVWRPTEREDSRHDVALFDMDQFAKKPRPYWKSWLGSKYVQEMREHAPTHWCDFPEGPESDVAAAPESVEEGR